MQQNTGFENTLFIGKALGQLTYCRFEFQFNSKSTEA